MKTRTKALLLTLCAVVLTAVTAYGTYAYFTDSDSDVNTFTVGSVEITLDETDVDNSTPGKERDTENEYHLIPGHSYIKDPTVHVADTSEDAWLFVEVNNGIAAIEGATDKGTIAQQIVNNGWKVLDGVSGVYYRQYTKGGTKDFVVFEKFVVDGDKTVNVPTDETVPDGKYDIADYDDKTVTITAYAIQAAGFDDAASAWTALQAQLKANS